MSWEDKLDYIRKEFNDPPENVPGGDSDKALRLVRRCKAAGFDLKNLQYTYMGKFMNPQKFVLETMDGKTIAVRIVKKKKNKNAYARLGYVLEKIGVHLRGNEFNLIHKHRKGFSGF